MRVTYQSNFRVGPHRFFCFLVRLCLVCFFGSNSSKFLFIGELCRVLRLPVSKLKCFCRSRGAISSGCRTRVVGACHLAGERDETILQRSLSHALFLWSIFMAETWEFGCLCPVQKKILLFRKRCKGFLFCLLLPPQGDAPKRTSAVGI